MTQERDHEGRAAAQELPEFVGLDACNFEDYPAGGTTSFAVQMRKAFGSRMALAGIVTDDTPCGRWIEKEIGGVTHRFFGMARVVRTTRKPLIPGRISAYFWLRRAMDAIRTLGVGKVFTRTPEFMFLLRRADWESICFCFAGTGNSVALSRYPCLRGFGNLYERQLFRALSANADRILAAADDSAIRDTIARSRGRLSPGAITKFPTRYDDAVFHEQDSGACRRRQGLPPKGTIIAVNGRLCWVKGWRFVVESFLEFLKYDPQAVLLFIGDGEDRPRIESEWASFLQKGSIRITGRVSLPEVSAYLGASDVVMVGSFTEGWSTAMVEAVACCKPIVATDVSGARDLIREGENGFVLGDRAPSRAAQRLREALQLKTVAEIDRQLRQRYAVSTLASDLESVWLQ